jgi:hypothetical protein
MTMKSRRMKKDIGFYNIFTDTENALKSGLNKASRLKRWPSLANIQLGSIYIS